MSLPLCSLLFMLFLKDMPTGCYLQPSTAGESDIPFGWAEDDLSSGDEGKNMIPRVPRRAKWDCATILSTYTNTENRPKVLSDVPMSSSGRSVAGSSVLFSRATGAPKIIKLSTKTGAPVGVPVKGEPAPSKVAPVVDVPKEDSDAGSGSEESGPGANLGEARRRDETPEERRARKRAVKDARKVDSINFVVMHVLCACASILRCVALTGATRVQESAEIEVQAGGAASHQGAQERQAGCKHSSIVTQFNFQQLWFHMAQHGYLLSRLE